MQPYLWITSSIEHEEFDVSIGDVVDVKVEESSRMEEVEDSADKTIL